MKSHDVKIDKDVQSHAFISSRAQPNFRICKKNLCLCLQCTSDFGELRCCKVKMDLQKIFVSRL
jgi:hypothetical protein